MEQVLNCLSRLVLVSRVSPDPAKGPFQMGSSAQSSFGGKFSIGSPQHHVPAAKTIGSRDRHRVHPDFYDVSFLPTTSASRAITFEGSLKTLTLPREEVVTVQELYNRAQPPFHSLPLIGFRYFLPSFLSPFRVCLGLGTFGTIHERLGSSLRSPRSSILHRVVVGVVVPTSFSPHCHCRCSRDPNRVRRGHLDLCEPWKLSAILDGMWPRASLDYTSPRNLLSPRNGLVPVFPRFVIT
ncbi:hypothetical protein CRG98_016562 [Punica granatum]|uniref:Uncharacterized protein n=1 Tax=Punica granatum TaxID=22663 RepID=A0A2I0K3B1_PUNGR|nr:hypothetical protein CRG98_016562 [Punica granatum]